MLAAGPTQLLGPKVLPGLTALCVPLHSFVRGAKLGQKVRVESEVVNMGQSVATSCRLVAA